MLNRIIVYGLAISLIMVLLLVPLSAWILTNVEYEEGLAIMAEKLNLSSLEIYRAPLHDYITPGIENEYLATIIAGIIGVLMTAVVTMLLSRLVVKKESVKVPTERSLNVQERLLSALLELASLGRYELLGGLLQQLSPQARLLSILMLQVSLLLSRNLNSILILGLAIHTIALLSRVPILRLCRDAIMLSLPFTIIIAFPSLIIGTSGGLLLHLDLKVSLDEIKVLLMFIIRVYFTTFNMVLLMSVTSLSSLLTALVYLKVPRPLIVLLTLAILNLFVILRNVTTRMLGFKSRFKIGGVVEFWKAQIRLITLLIIDGEAYTYNLRLALTSRGFTVKSYLADSQKVKTYDMLFLVIISTLILMILIVDRGLQ